MAPDAHPETLPDLLAPGLEVVFVGINPSPYSVQRGHYFARSTSRFWPAFSRSRLSAPARLALGVDLLGPDHDAALLPFGIGFTDVVKRPTPRAAGVRPSEFRAAAPSSCSAWSATARAWPASTASPGTVPSGATPWAWKARRSPPRCAPSSLRS